MTKFPSCNGERSWWLLSNDKCLWSATARTLWKKGESSALSVFHAFLGAICERALNLYVCRGGALWLAYHRTQTQSATQWECLFNPSTDIDSYYSYDTRTRQKCFIRTGYSFQPSIRLNSTDNTRWGTGEGMVVVKNGQIWAEACKHWNGCPKVWVERNNEKEISTLRKGMIRGNRKR